MADKIRALGNEDQDEQRRIWRKSSYSMTNGHCVETRVLESGLVIVQDSQALAGPELGIRPKAWLAFVAELRAS